MNTLSNIHYSEGEFPLNIYGYNNCYRDNVFGMYGGTQWVEDCGCHKDRRISDALFVTDVAVKESKTLLVTIRFSDGTSTECLVGIGKKYTVRYVENGNLRQVSGVLTAIWTSGVASDCPCSTLDYILQFDCSTDNNSLVVAVRTSTIRYLAPYNSLLGESTSLDPANTYGATALGFFKEIVLEDATIDSDGNVTAGTVSYAKLVDKLSAGLGGCATGTNKDKHVITTYNGVSTLGVVTAGKVLAAKLVGPIASGGTPGNGVLEHCTVKASEGRIIAVDAIIKGGKSEDGIAFEPKIVDSIVVDGVRSGTDMITLGATVFGVEAHGGTSTGGTVTGGTAIGIIGGLQFTIENGITTGGTTIKGIVQDGLVEGGSLVGPNIIGAIIYGGKNVHGTCTGGTTELGTDGYIKPGFTVLPKVSSPAVDFKTYLQKDPNDLIIWWKNNTLYTTLNKYNP